MRTTTFTFFDYLPDSVREMPRRRAAEALGLPMPEMPQDAQDRLRAIIPFCAPRNPVDCTAQITNQPQSLGTFADALVVDGGYKSVLAFWSQAGATEASATIVLDSSPSAPVLRPFSRSTR